MTVPVLTLDEPIPVQYCIPLWLRDQHIHLALERPGIGRIQGQAEPRSERVAVVCFGPSLNDTWEAIRDFPFVISCSGSHKFLVERGIIPHWHVEVDPREHKVTLMGPPQAQTEYLIASTCHPKVFEHLAGMNVKLWHVFDSTAEALRVLPRGEWAITGGCSVGLRAMGIAAFLGFRDIHVFGMDGCEGATGKHAAAHPNQPQGHVLTHYRGVEYRTTPGMLAAAKETFHELDQMPKATVTFHGDGLVQAMAKDYVRKPTENPALANVVGFMQPELISAEYRDLNRRLHRDNLAYGVGGAKHAEKIIKLATMLKTKDICDYGCGKGEFGKKIPWGIQEYDPAMPGKDVPPKPADIVICTDVLEHIEPDKLDFVLLDLKRCLLKVGFFTIYCGPAQKVLADGRNAHLIQRRPEWWLKTLRRFFRIKDKYVTVQGPVMEVFVEPKRAAEKVA